MDVTRAGDGYEDGYEDRGCIDGDGRPPRSIVFAIAEKDGHPANDSIGVLFT
jgi:hypothetical protein